MRRLDPKATSAQPQKRGLRGRLGQLALVGVFALLLIGGWSYHRAEAQMDNGLMDLGARMMRYDDARRQDAPRELVLNGQMVRFSSGTAPRTATQVLDHFEQRCAQVDGGLGSYMADLQHDHPEMGATGEPPTAVPTMREEQDGRGYVTCMDMGEEPVGIGELVERLGRYGESGDVSAIGEVRFVFAEQMGEGESASTHFVAMWTVGEFNVRSMFPDTGDAPGRDVPGVRRPPNTRRIVSSFERGQPQSMTVYEGGRSESDLESFYRDSLVDDGWALIEHPDAPGDPALHTGDMPRIVVAERGPRMVTVVFATRPTDGMASAAVFDAQ